MELALEPDLAWNDLILGSSELGELLNEPFRKRFNLEKHSSVCDIERACGTDLIRSYYTFALIRHPIDRICSLYNFVGGIVLDRMRDIGLSLDQLRTEFHAQAEAYPPLLWAAAQAFINSDDFAGFLERPELEWDSAFLPQVNRLRLISGELATHTLKLEQRSEWLPELRRRLRVSLQFPHVNASSQPLVQAQSLCAREYDLLRARFDDDFRIFGYRDRAIGRTSLERTLSFL